jgi:hypothetical protein
MATVVVAASENETSIAVIDFSNPAVPKVVKLAMQFASGCHVAVDGSQAAVGAATNGIVALVDLSNPAVPKVLGKITAAIGGVGAIAVRGAWVVIGDKLSGRVSLIDFTNPASPQALGSVQTSLNQVNSLAFVGPTKIAASSTADFQYVEVDFSTPSSPVANNIGNTGISGPISLDGDANASRIAAGDTNSSILKLFDAATNTAVATANTQLGGITSVAIASPLVLASSQNSPSVSLVRFGATTSVSTKNLTPASGWSSAINQSLGACGAINATTVTLLDLSQTPPAVLGTADSTLASIATLGITSVSVAQTAQATVTAALDFQAVRVSTSKPLPVKITNTGTVAFSITVIQSSNAAVFTPSQAPPLPVPVGTSRTFNVTFRPTAEMGYSGTLTLKTDAPTLGTFTVPLTGVGGLPHALISSTALDLGSVAVCQSGSQGLQVSNTGAVAMAVGAMTSGAPFSVAPPSLSVAPTNGTSTVLATFTPAAVGPASGTLTITTDDPANPSFTVSLSAKGLPTPPPGISVSPPSLNFGATPLMYFVGLRVTIVNTGPCQSLNVQLDSSGAPFFVTSADPTTVPPTNTTVSGVISGANSQRFVVVFAPTTPGPASGSLTVTSNDPAHPTVVIPLSGNAVALAPIAMELVLDRSGSMAAPAVVGTKMDALKQAVDLFADLVIPGQGDEMGSVQFDDAFNVLTPRAAFDTATQQSIKTDADTLTPRNWTSIGGGMQLAQSEVSGSALGRKVLLVFTDGLQNRPPDIATAQGPILGAGTEVYAIGLGQSQNISVADLSAIAASSNGKFFLTDDTLILRKNFVQILADAFRNNMAADPIINLQAGVPFEFPVLMTTCEARMSFVLNWDDPASQVGLTVRAPDGTTFHPTSASSNQLVRYGERPGYRYYQIAFPPLDPGSGLSIGPPQLGTWTMRIDPYALAGNTERCAVNVMVESELRLEALVHSVAPTGPVQILAQILHAGTAVTQAEVLVTVHAPLKSLAQVSTPPVVQKALNADRHPIPTGGNPLIPMSSNTYPMKRVRNRFVFELPPTKIDGVYHFEVTAKGKACGGVFQRYAAFSYYIGRQADRGKTKVAVTAAGRYRAAVRITPRDARGIPLGPGLATRIRGEVTNGTVLGTRDMHDGSYNMIVSWSPKVRRPQLTLQLGDATLNVSLQKIKKG